MQFYKASKLHLLSGDCFRNISEFELILIYIHKKGAA